MKLTTHFHLVPRWKNAWSYTSTPQYAFTVWCSVLKIKHGDSSTSYLYHPVPSSSWGSNFTSSLCSQASRVYSSLGGTDQDSHPHIIHKILALCRTILTICVLGRWPSDKRSCTELKEEIPEFSIFLISLWILCPVLNVAHFGIDILVKVKLSLCFF
jgi:hypothetical protein